MKLEIENAGVWRLNTSIWAFKCWHLVFMKLTPAAFVQTVRYLTFLRLCKKVFLKNRWFQLNNVNLDTLSTIVYLIHSLENAVNL